MKKVKIFGKSVPIMLVALLVLASSGVAVLVHTYGTIIGSTISVESGVIVEGGDLTYTIGDSPAVAGNTYLSDVFTIKNKAQTSTEITLDTRCNNTDGYDDGTQTNMSIDWIDVGGWKEECDGIVTSYYGVLELTKKDINTWQATGEPIQITYTLTGEDFVINEAPPTNYVFVYAMDKENRFQNYATVMKVTDVDESLPMTGDWNAGTIYDSTAQESDGYANYCGYANTFDSYTHCVGAKIWAVPESAIGTCVDNVCELTWSGMANYYWETDLISYTKGPDNKINLLANGGGFDFVVENALASNLGSDVYTIKTDVTPV